MAHTATLLWPIGTAAYPASISQPVATVSWSGGTGPFDVLVEWDTDPTFGNSGGLKQTASATGATSPTDLYPPAALGDTSDGTVWYVRATVTDTSDSHTAQDSDQFTYADPRKWNRYLYQYANVGVGFTPTDDPAGGWGEAYGGTKGPDGDPIQFDRYLYQYANVGVGFRRSDEPSAGWGEAYGGTWGDGDELTFNRYLYQYANAVDAQPCPYLFDVTPTQVETGSTVTVIGEGLVSASAPTADAYGAEVRLYATQDLAGSYTVLPIVTYTEGTPDSITVSIPAGATTGWVAVVHTAGTPTCAGSNFLRLEVVQVPADQAAGWWIEVWNIRNNAATIRPLSRVLAASFEHVPSDIGRGSITVPADHPELDNILDTAGPTQALIKVYLHGRFAYGFFPDRYQLDYTDDGGQTVVVSGPGQEDQTRWGRLLWRDYPAQPAQARRWLYGDTTDLLDWGDFDSARNLVDNEGAEDGLPISWTVKGTASLYASTAELRSGAYSLEVTANALGDGAYQQITVYPQRRVLFDSWVKTNTAVGATLTVDVHNPADGSTIASTTTSLASTWTPIVLDFIPPAGVTKVWVRWYITAGTVPAVFYVDDVTAIQDIGPLGCNSTTAQLSRDYATDGVAGLEISFGAGGDSEFVGAVYTMDVSPNREYTHTVYVTGPAGETVELGLRLGGVRVEDTVTLSGLGTWHQLSVTGTAGPDETVGRAALRSTSANAFTVYADQFTMTPGLPAATAGKIVTDVLAAIQTRGTLSWLTVDFDSTTDSAGQPWPETLSLALDPSWTLYDLLAKLTGLGYEWELAPSDWRTGGDSGWQLRLAYRPRLGTIRTTASDPTVLPGPGYRTTISSSIPPKTVVYTEGRDGVWSTAAADAAWLTSLERREEYIANRAALTGVETAAAAQQRLDALLKSVSGFQLTVDPGADVIPYLDVWPLDSIRVHLPALYGAGIDDGTYRIAAMRAVLDDEVRYTVDFGLYQLTQEAATALLIGRLLERQAADNWRPGEGSVGDGGQVGFVDDTPTGSVTQTDLTVTVEQHTIDTGHPEILDDLDDVSVGGAVQGDMVYRNASGLWVVVGGTKADGKAPMIQADGSVAWDTPSGGGGGGGSIEELSWSTAGPGGAYDDEFDDGTIDASWTRVYDTSSPKGTWTEAANRLIWYQNVYAADELDVMTKPATIPVGTFVEAAFRIVQIGRDYIAGFLGFSDSNTWGSGTQVGCFLHRAPSGFPHLRALIYTYTGFTGRTQQGVLNDIRYSAIDAFYVRVKYEASNTWGLYISSNGAVWHTVQTDYSRTMTPTHLVVGAASLWADRSLVEILYFRVGAS